MIGLIAVTLVVVVQCGCGCLASKQLPITGGRYVSEPPGEWIQVAPDEMVFYVNVGRESPAFVTRKLAYRVAKDGQVMPYAVTSADAVFGFGRFDWFLEDGHIVKKEHQSGKTLSVFSLED